MPEGIHTIDLPLKGTASEFLVNTDSGLGMEGPFRVTAANAAAQLAIAGGTVFGTWTALSATVGTYAGQRADVLGDAGTHTDPVTGALGVANSGVYSWSTSPAGWRWISADSQLALVISAEAAATSSATSATAAQNAATSAAASAAASASSAAAAGTSVTIVAAYASAAGIAGVFTTKAAADAGVGSFTDGQYIEVLADETQGAARTVYKKVTGAWAYQTTLDQYIMPAATPGRNWGTMCAPFVDNNTFIDNVLAIQNKSRGNANTIAGNAAINFLDNAGTERGAIGYSRNNSTTPGGYYANTLYIEIGNAFTTDSDNTNFRVIQTIPAGGHWAGPATPISYFPIEVVSYTGEINFLLPGPGALTVGMASTKFRVREREYFDQFSLATNIYDMDSAVPLVQDNPALPSWELSFGGGLDHLKVKRYPAGSTAIAQGVVLFLIENGGRIQVSQTITNAGADGTIAVTAHAAGYSALTAKNAASNIPAGVFYNAATSGDNQFVNFATEASYTARGSITYNRGSGVVAYNTTSDRRAKDIFGPVESALTRLMQLKPYRGRMHGAALDIDLFIADEVQQIVPAAVTGEPNGEAMQQLDKTQIIPLIVAAVQEQQIQIDEIKRKVA